MKKNKLWAKIKLREELVSWRGVEGGIDEDGINYVLNIIDQLDEPEVLTQEWLDNNVIHVRGLGDIIEAESVENIIVPNQEITYEDAIKVIAENIDTDEFSVGLYIEALNNNEKYEFLTDKWIEDNTSPVDDEGRLYVWKRDLQNVIVPKQELPVVPRWFDEWWKDIPKGGGNLFYNIGRFQEELFSFETREAYDYITDPDNKKKLLDIIVNELDYKVEEEQKYYVDLDTAAYVAKWKDNDRVDIYTDNISGSDEFEFHLTEQEIKNYDERFWAFDEPVGEDNDD